MTSLRNSIYRLLNLQLGTFSLVVDSIFLALILINCVSIVLESVATLRLEHSAFFIQLEYYSVVLFSIEYFLRFWSIVENPEFKGFIKGRIRYMFTAGSIIDLLAIIPFYLEILALDLRFIRIFRLLRILRLFKVARYLNALDMISTVVKKRKEHLIITVMLVVFMLVMSSTIIYYIENPTQPERFSSIPETMWWGVATLTTIGYGDMYPHTPLGKILGSIISILGIGLFALPTGILTSGFAEELSNREKKKAAFCVHCGKNPHD